MKGREKFRGQGMNISTGCFVQMRKHYLSVRESLLSPVFLLENFLRTLKESAREKSIEFFSQVFELCVRELQDKVRAVGEAWGLETRLQALP